MLAQAGGLKVYSVGVWYGIAMTFRFLHHCAHEHLLDDVLPVSVRLLWAW